MRFRIASGVFAFILSVAGVSAQTITHTYPDGRTTTATALSPSIVRVDNTAAGQNVAPEQSVLAMPTGDFSARSKISFSFGPDGALHITTPLNSLVDDGSRPSDNGLTETTLLIAEPGTWRGGGERGHSIAMSGDTLVMYNRQNYGYTGSDPRVKQMNITMPVVLSDRGFALVFDDYAAAELILGNPVRYITESTKPVSYYYVYGSTPAELTKSLTELTGRQPLPPLWSLGYITSKYGYRTQAETEATVDTLKQAGYPLDGIVLDLYWYGKEDDMGRFAWDADQWPDPKGMLASLKDRGVNTVAISQPYVITDGRGAANYDELAAAGALLRDKSGAVQPVETWVGKGGMFDVSRPEDRAWLTQRYKELTDMGMGGWWGDLGEPEVHPETGLHANGLPTRLYHNKYGNDWSEIIANLYATNYPDRRLMTLMRGGTTGLQRFSVFPWSTDVSRSWGGLEPQVRIMLNSGLSGLGYMASDLGGFALGDQVYMPDLYLRWLQMGLFSPVFRTHGTKFAEPYNYPMYESELLTLVKDRYRWLPYNYTLAYENTSKGWPLVRPLDFHGDTGQGTDDEFLWGRDVLVAPVLTEGTRSRNVYLPGGSRWIDFNNTASVYAGGSTVAAYPAPLGTLPLFVRAGAFIPTADYSMENTGDYRADNFTVNYYPLPGIKSSYTLFDDNRMTPGTLERGQYRLIHFDGNATAKKTTVKITSEGTYPGAPAKIEFTFKVNCLAAAPRSVKAGKETLQYRYDPKNRTLEFTVSYTPSTKLEVSIAQ